MLSRSQVSKSHTVDLQTVGEATEIPAFIWTRHANSSAGTGLGHAPLLFSHTSGGGGHKEHSHFCQIKSWPTVASQLKQQHICSPTNERTRTTVRQRLLTRYTTALGEFHTDRLYTAQRGEERVAGNWELLWSSEMLMLSVCPSVFQRFIKNLSMLFNLCTQKIRTQMRPRPSIMEDSLLITDRH